MSEKNSKVGIGIVGGTGFGAGELMRLLSFRDDSTLLTVVSSSKAGSDICETHPQLKSVHSGTFAESLNLELFKDFEHKVLFMALPHGVSSSKIEEIIEESDKKGFKIIDLSGDFRLADKDLREKHYPGTAQFSATKEKFIYGAPELHKDEIKNARFVANCGCFALSGILASAPLAIEKKPNRIVIDGKSGTSGAGRNLASNFHHANANANVFAYKVLTHRHEAEIAQGIDDPKSEKFELSFVPHVMPCVRGIYLTAHIFLDESLELEEIQSLYEDFYKDSPFIRLRSEAPHLQHVVGSNFCDISISVRDKNVVVIAAMDNLIKGMCGNALQNMNLMCSLDETKGLLTPGLGPI